MRTALAAVILLLSSHLQAAISAGPERPVAPPVFGPGYGTHYPQDLASDGEDFLALWLEQTPGRGGLYAVIVDERGDVKPMPATRIASGDQAGAANAVWTGDSYLVTYVDHARDGVVAIRVSRDGQVVGAPVAIAGRNRMPRALAWNGRRVLLLLHDVDSSSLLATTLTPDGVVDRTVSLPVATGSFQPAVAAAGETFVVAWSETRHATTASGLVTSASAVKAVRLDGTGASIDAAPVTLLAELPGHTGPLSAASDGERVGVAVVVEASVRMFTVDAETMQITAHAARPAGNGTDVDVVHTSRGFVAGMLTRGNRALDMIPFDGSGRSEIIVSERGTYDLELSASGTAVMAVWSDYKLSTSVYTQYRHLFGVALDRAADEPVSEIVPLAITATAQANPAIAPAGERSLVVWADLTGTDNGEVVAVRVDRSGNVLDAAPFVIGVTSSQYARPAAVFTGEVWLVVWTQQMEPARMNVARVATDGRVLSTVVLDGWSTALASNGKTTVLAIGTSIARFTRGGELIEIAPATTRNGYSPALATNGSEFLLVWTEGSDWWQFPSPKWRDLWAIRLDEHGVPFGGPFEVASGNRDEGDPLAASDGRDFLVAYSHDKEEVRAKRVLREGVLADTTAAADGMFAASEPWLAALSRSETGYVVAVSGLERWADVSVVPLDRSGAASGPPLLLARSDFEHTAAALEYANGSVLAAYTRTVAEAPFAGIARVFVRTLGESVMRRRAVR
jgi:hypothetical protein